MCWWRIQDPNRHLLWSRWQSSCGRCRGTSRGHWRWSWRQSMDKSRMARPYPSLPIGVADWIIRFKLHLRPKVQSSGYVTNKIPPLPQGKSAIDVFSDFLRYLHQCARNFIEETHANDVEMWHTYRFRSHSSERLGRSSTRHDAHSCCPSRINSW